MKQVLQAIAVSAFLLISACDGGGSDATRQDVSNTRVPQVINGTVVPDGAYPWMVYLFVSYGDDRGGVCGGTLISDRWILTAAHCFNDRDTDGAPATEVFYLLGSNDTREGEYISAGTDYLIHPDYEGPGVNDIALIEMPFATDIEPITIPAVESAVPQDTFFGVGEIGTVAGWGSRVPVQNVDSSPILLATDIPILSAEQCGFFNSSTDISRTICAGGTLEVRGSCFGDSGGPLMVPRGDRLVLAGIVSGTFSCAAAGQPAIYTRVTQYANWINERVGNLIYYNGSEDENVNLIETLEYLPPDGVISSVIQANGRAFFRATGVELITLETLRTQTIGDQDSPGDADLFVYSVPDDGDFTDLTLIPLVCESRAFDTEIDQCFVDPSGDYLVEIRGFLTSDYIVIARVDAGDAPETEIELVEGCLDTDGDGWGWNGERSCQPPDSVTVHRCIDSDGDGWGWNGADSCLVQAKSSSSRP